MEIVTESLLDIVQGLDRCGKQHVAKHRRRST